jgi:hypothetical protein
MSGKLFALLLFRLGPASVGRFSVGLAPNLPPAARPTACSVSAPCGSGSGRLAHGAGTPARIGRTLTIASRDYGKREGGDLSVRQDGGIPLSDPSSRPQRGAKPPLWNPRPLRSAARRRAAPPRPPLFRLRSVEGVGAGPCACLGWGAGRARGPAPTQRSLSPAREAAFRVGPLGDASSARGGAGGPEASLHVAQRRGSGGGEAVTHHAGVESGQTYLASVTLGAGLESSAAPPSAGSCSSGAKLAFGARSITRRASLFFS